MSERNQRYAKGFLVLAALPVFINLWFGGEREFAVGAVSVLCAGVAVFIFWWDD